MENILDIYARPYDPSHPVICMDEMSKNLRADVKESLPTQVGRIKKEDQHYIRNGVANLFVFLEPLAGKRYIVVSETKTRFDWAEAMAHVLETYYSEVEKSTIVLDNYSTHNLSAFYEAFDPIKARKLVASIDLEFTPAHASWLNAVELENSVMRRQLLEKRIGSIDELTQRLDTYQNNRNAAIKGVNWQFTTEDARIKLKKLYPSFIYDSVYV